MEKLKNGKYKIKERNVGLMSADESGIHWSRFCCFFKKYVDGSSGI